MKKVLTVASLLLLVVLFRLALYRQETGREPDDEVVVGLVVTGSKETDAWSKSHYEALQDLSTEMGFRLICVENVSGIDDGIVPVIADLAKRKARIICVAGMNFGSTLARIADGYGGIRFLHCGGLANGKNLYAFFGKMYQARYLSGIVAGMRTGTDEIGFVAAEPVDEVIRNINAFALGVRSVNPGATVRVSFSGLWDNVQRERDCANLLIDSHGVDVIAYHQNNDAAARTADERGIYSITFHIGNRGELSEHCLTGAIWRWKPFYRECIEDILSNRPMPRHYWAGLEKRAVGLAPLSSLVAPGTAERVEDAKIRIVGGEWDVFHGPIRDNTGTLRVEPGSAMSDDQIIHDFKWYVVGVAIDE